MYIERPRAAWARGEQATKRRNDMYVLVNFLVRDNIRAVYSIEIAHTVYSIFSMCN